MQKKSRREAHITQVGTPSRDNGARRTYLADFENFLVGVARSQADSPTTLPTEWARKLAFYIERLLEEELVNLDKFPAYPRAAIDLRDDIEIRSTDRRVLFSIKYDSFKTSLTILGDDDLSEFVFSKSDELEVKNDGFLFYGKKFSFNFSTDESKLSVKVQPLADLRRILSDNDSTDKRTKLIPRWAEALRPKKQVKLRLAPELIADMDAAASREGLTRNDWIERAITKSLTP